MTRGAAVVFWRRLAITLPALAIVIVVVWALAYQQGLVRFAYPDHDVFPVRGIDVSHYQGVIDWERVSREGLHFAYVKVSEGGDWRDP